MGSDLTFSALEDEAGNAARTQLLVRANDPLYEASFQMYTARLEAKIWTHTLTQLAAHFGSSAPVSGEAVLIDKRRQWDQLGNIRKNSAVCTLLRRNRR